MPDYVIHIIAYICVAAFCFKWGWNTRRNWAQKRWDKDGMTTLTMTSSDAVNFEPGMKVMTVDTIGDGFGEEQRDA
jgi:hypothetical protein